MEANLIGPSGAEDMSVLLSCQAHYAFFILLGVAFDSLVELLAGGQGELGAKTLEGYREPVFPVGGSRACPARSGKGVSPFE